MIMMDLNELLECCVDEDGEINNRKLLKNLIYSEGDSTFNFDDIRGIDLDTYGNGMYGIREGDDVSFVENTMIIENRNKMAFVDMELIKHIMINKKELV